MTILAQLEENKGTVSSALGKALAEKVIKGDKKILEEAVTLIKHDSKNVRAGAAKIIEMVAKKKPELVSGYLKELQPAFDAPEPQTRWMIIHTYGLCAHLNEKVAESALKKAEEYIKADSGACLWNRTMLYLGYLGSVSEKQAQKVFSLFETALETVPSQTKGILDGLVKMIPVMNEQLQSKVLKCAEKYTNNSQSGIKNQANKLVKKLKK